MTGKNVFFHLLIVKFALMITILVT